LLVGSSGSVKSSLSSFETSKTSLTYFLSADHMYLSIFTVKNNKSSC